MDFASNEFLLSRIEKGSESTNRKHHEQLRKATGTVTPELLRSENKPTVFWYLWVYFCEVHNGERLTFQELKAWSEMTQTELSPFEVTILRQLNRAALAKP